jgi:hypothetical protein
MHADLINSHAGVYSLNGKDRSVTYIDDEVYIRKIFPRASDVKLKGKTNCMPPMDCDAA